MEAYHKLGHHKSLDASNYRLNVKPETCKACGLCLHKCPTDSLTLERREEIVDPPQDIRDYSRRFMEDKKEGIKLLRGAKRS